MTGCVDTQKEYKPETNIHHIVAQKAPGVDKARKILFSHEIKTSDRVNEVEISTKMHVHLHNKIYYEFINEIIELADQLGGEKMIYLTLELLAAALQYVDGKLN